MQARAFHIEGASVGQSSTGCRSSIRQFRDLRDQVNNIHTEAVDTAVKPPAHHFVDGLANFGILPVQVRLLLRK